jgi:peptide/nickel transport system substrate-binding protein
MSFVYDTLMWKDSTGNLLGWLASAMNRAADDVTYTFKLRPGVVWHDGRPLTASDVAFTFEYFAAQTLSPLVVAQPNGIAKVSVPDASTVVIRTARPDVTFPAYVAGSLPIVPRHIWSSIKSASQDMSISVLVGSGPYRVTSYNGNDGALLYQAVGDHFLGKPFVSQIQLIPVGNDFQSLQGNEVDEAGWETSGGIQPAQLAPFRDSSAYSTISSIGGFASALYWNLGKGGALADVRFRRACAMAINRADLVRILYGGDGLPGNPGFIAPGAEYHVDVPQYPFDVAGANALLDQAGYRRGSGGTRRDSSGNQLAFGLIISPDQAAFAQLLVNALQAIGIRLTPQALPPGPQFYGAKMSGHYDMLLSGFPGPSGGGPDTDPDVMRLIFSSQGPPNLSGATKYHNPTFDALAAQQLATFDVAARKQIVAKMQQIIANDLPVLTLTYPRQYNIARRSVFDAWYYTPGGFGPGIDSALNKQALVTGQKTGLKISAA